ncbi:hypothetical protein ACE6H2_021898 [Prunus campanulata]
MPAWVVKSRVEFLGREWNFVDIGSIVFLSTLHVLVLLAPFHFNWRAFWLAVALYYLTGLGVTLSYHRQLSHRSFKLPKWLEYFFAYCGVLSIQYEGLLKNVDDLKRQKFYRFLHVTYPLHSIAFGVLLYALGGMPFLAWGLGVRAALFAHATFALNSICHRWGKKVWDTGDMSRNNWVFGLLTHGEGWHNNHHAFQYSAWHGFEWWEVDVIWYVIRFLEIVGLATDVKLPSETQKKRKALSNKLNEEKLETQVNNTKLEAQAKNE